METQNANLIKDPGEQEQEFPDLVRSIVFILVTVTIVAIFLLRPACVVGQSMEQTFHDGDLAITCRLFYTPKYGDVVILRKDTFKNEPIIKRVIATEGQTVDIDFDAGVVYVDGAALDEPYTNTPTNLRENFEGPVTVPEGCVFVMGDNRNHSTDSRTATIGCVDTRYILGKVILHVPVPTFLTVRVPNTRLRFTILVAFLLICLFAVLWVAALVVELLGRRGGRGNKESQTVEGIWKKTDTKK